MYPKTEQVSYRLKNGTIINYVFDTDKGLTLQDISNVANMCMDEMQYPTHVFIRTDLYAKLMKSLYESKYFIYTPLLEFSIARFNLPCGPVIPIPVKDSYIPFLVGDEEDFKDNDFYTIFEETING